MFNRSKEPAKMLPASAVESFARLADDVTLHVSPTYGFLRHDISNESVFLHKETKDIVLACNGTRRISEVIEEQLPSDPEGGSRLIGAIVELVDLVRRDFMLLSEDAFTATLKQTGALDAYYPLNLQVELTTACNLSCYYCYRDAQVRSKESRLATNELISILGTLQELGLKSVELTGGEPLLHKDFNKILQFCGEHFSMVAILTNGTLLTESQVNAMLPYRRNMLIGVSLDGSTAEVHDRRRGRNGAFDRTTDGLHRLARNGFITRVSMVVDEQNWNEVEATIILAKELGANLFTYTPLLPIGRGKEHFPRWEGHDPFILYQQEQELRTKYSGFIHVLPEESVFDLQEPGGCGAGYRTYAMDPRGHIRPCVTFEPGIAILGSLRDQSPYDVFRSPLAAAFAGLIPPATETCNECYLGSFCQGCQMRAIIASNWLHPSKCIWLQKPATAHWFSLCKQNIGNVA